MKVIRPAPPRRIVQQIRRLLWATTAAIILIILVMTATLLGMSHQYDDVLQNATAAADFNTEFKATIDSEMYNHVIRPRSEGSVDDLPTDELDAAVRVLERLEETTVLPDNLWRIHSMLNMCENLRGYMLEIAGAERYDTRMELLDRNIRGETGLTTLIETYMHDYIDAEVRELARLHRQMQAQSLLVLGLVLVGVLVFSIVIFSYSVHVTRSITAPISALSAKVEHFAEGNAPAEDSPAEASGAPTASGAPAASGASTASGAPAASGAPTAPIDTDIVELRTLDRGFDEMAARVNSLIARQVDDQRTLHRAELELLQAQINPHFLYNTLDSIAILAEMERNEDVVTMVTSLSTFFRNSLNRGEDLISLRAECEQVNSYLAIQKIRYSDILRAEMDIPEALTGCLVPKLILQPLVENALYHGIKNRRGVGTITITGETEGDDLLLRVRDNGVGMTPEQVQALQAGIYEDRHTGLGLLNVHKRIRLYCGEPYGLTFASELGHGTTVTVRLPRTLAADRHDKEMIS